MKVLNILSKYKYLILLFIVLLSIILSNLNKKSIYNLNTLEIKSYIISIKEKEDSIQYILKKKEKIIANCFECENKYQVGDYVKIKGEIKQPQESTIFNIFNYKTYLKNKKINYIFSIKDMYLIKKNKNILFIIKNSISNQINKSKKTSAYLNAFILGDSSYISVKKSFQINQTSHLFAISGMHISLLTVILLKILKKIKYKYVIVFIFIIFYMFISNFSPSLLRAGLFFILLKINKKFKTIEVLMFTISILLLINPYLIKDIGFLYSSVISYFLILSTDLLKNQNKIYQMFLVSLISFLASIPITIYTFYQINFFSIFLNIIYVLFVSTIIFPLSLVTFFLPVLDNIFFFFINILEITSVYFSNIKFFIVTIGKINITFLLIYYLILYCAIKLNKKYIMLIIIFLILAYNKNLFKNPTITFVDVEQGDCILVTIKNKTMLVDTGGIYNKDYIGENLVSYIKSLGIKKIDYLVLTHGHLDHLKYTLDIVDNIKVKNIYFNNNSINSNEQFIIDNLKNINYEFKKNNDYFYLNKTKIYVLNPNEDLNENDSSIVLYFNIYKYNILLLGDISKVIEERLIKEYNLKVDILKVAHHGSNTSSSEKFINEIKPKYSIIQVGIVNKFKHPNKETLEVLNNSIVCKTSTDYSIKFILKKKLKLITKNKNNCN